MSPRRRIDAIDFARGVAVALMILSHGVKGLLRFDQIPEWGLVPIHLITKFSSTLFILVFGVSLAAAYLPAVGTEAWPEKRQRLLIRGLKVFFWYKVLTIVEMSHLYSRSDILDTLLYKAFPVYVEILGFYALALLWVPFILPLWKKTSVWLQAAIIPAIAAISYYLYHNFSFWGLEPLQAVLVEHEKHYTWGQLSRAPLILLGLVIGEVVRRHYWETKGRLILAGSFGAVSVMLFALFFWHSHPLIRESLISVAKNEGKHPPELGFMLFSGGGAFGVLALTLLGGEKLAWILRPITTIGKDSLQSFIFHIFVIFVFYRFLFDYWQGISYSYALALTGILIALTAVWIKISGWVQRSS